MTLIIVSGALANKPGNGGGTWERMSWVSGLRRLGCDVYFVEQIAPEACVDAAGRVTPLAGSINFEWFQSTTKWFGVAERSALLCSSGEEYAGIAWPRLVEVAEAADLLINLSGHLTLAPLLDRIRRKAYVDVDPGFTQFWHVDPNTPFHIGDHDFYFTVGQNIGSPECSIPTGGIHWRPIRQPVVLDDWPVAAMDNSRRFTTIGSWRGAFGPVRVDGRTYGLKVHEFRKCLALPQLARGVDEKHPLFEIALDIHAADAHDLAALSENGWQITDPREVAGDAAMFRHYIQQSSAEFSVAQGIYVETNSGWFSDRTVRYLASGKPALVQETGFSSRTASGRGLVAFRNLEEAVCGAESIVSDYSLHCEAARKIAQEYFHSDTVLGRMLQEVGISP